MRRAICAILLLAGLAGAALGRPAGGKKYALLVGVGDYASGKFAPLRFTRNDVEELAVTLRDKAGFSSVRVLSTPRGTARTEDAPNLKNIKAEVKTLLSRKSRDDTILIGLAGHGLQRVVKRAGRDKPESFFCPADAQLNDPESLLSLGELFGQLDECGAGVRLLLVDACREEPDSGRNLDLNTLPRLPRGTAVLFSCRPGERAFETDKLPGAKKGHGVFFHYVLEGLRGAAKNRDGEVTWDDLSIYVRRQVSRQVPLVIREGARQTPHEIRDLEGESPLLVAAEADLPAVEALTRSALEAERRGDLEEALGLFDRARRTHRQQLARVLRDTPRSQHRRAFDRRLLAQALALGRVHSGRPGCAEGSATWLVNAKALTEEALARSAAAVRESGDPEVAKLAARLGEVRGRLAFASLYASPPGGAVAQAKLVESLGKQEQELSGKLAAADGAAPGGEWVTLGSVTKGLPAGGVFLDVARVEAWDFKAAAWGPHRYVAWVTAPGQVVRVVDLGPASDIDEAIRALRESLKKAPEEIRTKGEPKAEEALRGQLEKLSKRVLHPLLKAAGKAGPLGRQPRRRPVVRAVAVPASPRREIRGRKTPDSVRHVGPGPGARAARAAGAVAAGRRGRPGLRPGPEGGGRAGVEAEAGGRPARAGHGHRGQAHRERPDRVRPAGAAGLPRQGGAGRGGEGGAGPFGARAVHARLLQAGARRVGALG
jgi:hypothetical protein